MQWSSPACLGFALAATLCGDRGAGLAAPGLHEEVRAQVTEPCRALARAPRAERRLRVAALVRGYRAQTGLARMLRRLDADRPRPA